jgi:hypothetical protein
MVSSKSYGPARLGRILVAAAFASMPGLPGWAAGECNVPSFTWREDPAGGGGAFFGQAVAALGDFDADGFEDFAVGAPHRTPEAGCAPRSAANTGKVYIYSGKSGRSVHVIEEEGECGGFGHAIAAERARAGGPSKALLAVGAPCFDGARGLLVVYTVSAAGVHEVFRRAGEGSGDELGSAVAIAGDLDGDGPGEIIVGAPGNPLRGERAGMISVFRIDGSPFLDAHGGAPFEGFGTAVAGAGDFDGDGAPDLLIGSQDPRPEGDRSGKVTVLDASGAVLLSLAGSGDDRIGASLARLGDADGDGFDDFLAGAPGRPKLPACEAPAAAPPAAEGPGKAFLVLGGDRPPAEGGTAGKIAIQWKGEHPDAGLGAHVAAAGDIDGDGSAEVIIAAPGTKAGDLAGAGKVYLHRGGDGALLWTLSGGKADAALGRILAPAGDQDGDGAGDLFASTGTGEVLLFGLGDADHDGIRDACQDCAAPAAISLGSEEPFTLSRALRRRCFRIDLEAGRTIRATVKGSHPEDGLTLLARWGMPASPERYDHASAGASLAGPGLLIPSTRGGPLFFLAFAKRLGSDFRDFALLVDETPALVAAKVIPGSAAAGEVQVTVIGSGLRPGMSFALQGEDPAARFPSREVVVVSPERAEAGFDLTAAEAGPYSLEVIADGSPAAALPDAFSVLPPASGGDFRVTLTAPGEYRNNSRFRLTLKIANTGDRILPAPLFRVTGPPGTAFDFPRDPRTHLGEAVGLGLYPFGIDGDLPPGSEVEIPIWFRVKVLAEEDCLDVQEATARFAVALLDPRPGALIPWKDLEAPRGMDGAEWSRIRGDLEARLGSTWPDYVRALSRLSARLGRRGRAGHSALPPFELAVRAASGLPAAAITGKVLDSATRAPLGGLAILALEGGEGGPVRAVSPAAPDGYFSLEWVEERKTYRIETVEFGTGAVHESGSIEVPVPAGEDVLGIEVLASGTAGGRTIEPVCDDPEATGLPHEPIAPPSAAFTEHGSLDLDVISACDPNEKDGSGGQGGDVEVDPSEEIEYTIYFENTAGEGGAAARRVTIVDVLDSRLDWTTVRLKDVVLSASPEEIRIALEEEGLAGASCESIPVRPIGSGFDFRSPLLEPVSPAWSLTACWSGSIRYRAGDPAAVDCVLSISATVGPCPEPSSDGGESGIIAWVLQADLGLLSEVPPDSGFLAYGCGEAGEDDADRCGGYVSFSVRPLSGLADGTEISNEAEIVFDEMDPVTTDPSSTVTVGERPLSSPEDPSPATDSEGVDPTGFRLAWQALYATSHDLSLWSADLGEARPAEEGMAVLWKTGLAEAHYPPGEDLLALPPSSRFYWQVVARNDLGEVEGPVWGFSTAAGGEGASFRRADVDGNGRLEITDPILALGFLFLGNEDPSCLDAVDADDSGVLDLSDAIVALTYLFLGGIEIPPPGPSSCGPDPTEDPGDPSGDLGCGDPGACAVGGE